ncbi:MAG: aminotransferase class I/II-fold pyridoxal phosphate-dependent enzyme [Gemmatimonadota bacterium]
MTAHRPTHGGLSTQSVHAGSVTPAEGAPVVPPLVQSATYYGGWHDATIDLRYARYGNNPNQEEVATKLAALEGTESAIALGSGMAATAMTLLALTRAGDHVVASRQIYGTTQSFLQQELARRGVAVDFVDPDSARTWRLALKANTRLLFMEVPTNPTLRIHDPRPLVRLAREAGVPLVVDSTFASPVNLRPASLGVDVVIHSATKYLGGHSDVVAGVVCGSTAIIDEVRRMLMLYGPALDPHAAWLLARGLRTLSVRVQRQNESALALARWFKEQSGVKAVIHPGLPEHPDHELAKEILQGYGGMLSVVLEGGSRAANTFCRALQIALYAPSLGGVETLVSQPRFTSQVGLGAKEMEEQGIPEGFVRISVGLEDVPDLERDFGRALQAARADG